jgi:hypothetical protein
MQFSQKKKALNMWRGEIKENQEIAYDSFGWRTHPKRRTNQRFPQSLYLLTTKFTEVFSLHNSNFIQTRVSLGSDL